MCYICLYLFIGHTHTHTHTFLDGYCCTVQGLLDWFEVDLGFTELLFIQSFDDGYCSTVQGLLDWFEVDLGFTELLFIQIGLCVLCVFDPLTLFCFDL